MGLLNKLLDLLKGGFGRGKKGRKKGRKGRTGSIAAKGRTAPPRGTGPLAARGTGKLDPAAVPEGKAPPKDFFSARKAGDSVASPTGRTWGKAQGDEPRSKTNELTQTMRIRIESFFRRKDEPKDLKRRKPLIDDLKPMYDRGDVAAIGLLLEDRTAEADSLLRTEAARIEALNSLEKVLRDAARSRNAAVLKPLAVRLVGEIGLLGDDILKEAREVRGIVPKLQEALEAREPDTIETWCRDFDVRLVRLDKEMHRQSRFLAKVGGKLLKGLTAKDFAAVADLSEQVITAGSVVAAGGEDVEIPEVTDRTEVSAVGNQDKWKLIDKQLLQLVETLKARQYPFVVPLAILVHCGSAVMGDQVFGRAVELIKGGMALRKMMKGEIDPNLLRSASVLARTAEVFDGLIVNRSNQMADLAESCANEIKGGQHAAARKAAMDLLRTSELLADPTVTKAAKLRSDIAKVESALKRKSLGEASLLLDHALET
ncbi:MAG: hypothetical protein VKP57_05145 [Candidatus Sericytochromatia bacterium]|nr:hypothetical protein [Candidatus Sericytochromatia bacterium]